MLYVVLWSSSAERPPCAYRFGARSMRFPADFDSALLSVLRVDEGEWLKIRETCAVSFGKKTLRRVPPVTLDGSVYDEVLEKIVAALPRELRVRDSTITRDGRGKCVIYDVVDGPSLANRESWSASKCA